MFERRTAYKPFKYPWAVEVTKKQQQIHWLPEEVPMAKDAKDWAAMSAEEKNLALNIMLLFTQSDADVLEGYLDHYLSRFKNPEIRHMLTTIAAQEVIHVHAYSYLMESLGMSDSVFSHFTNIKEMAAKHEAALSMTSESNMDLAHTMATFGGFIEGLQLFASFIMLLNFQRMGRLQGMGQIVAWSVRDETLHSAAICKLCNDMVDELGLDRTVLDPKIVASCVRAVELEDAFIDRAYELGPVKGLTPHEVKQFIRYVADRRLESLRIAPLYGIDVNPQPWFEDTIGGVEHANFFESRSTAYAKGATTGDDWF